MEEDAVKEEREPEFVGRQNDSEAARADGVGRESIREAETASIGAEEAAVPRIRRAPK